ncbi:MAG: hypothetical protein ACR2NR_11995 [Solirubrobacteraceae bacterium]
MLGVVAVIIVAVLKVGSLREGQAPPALVIPFPGALRSRIRIRAQPGNSR